MQTHTQAAEKHTTKLTTELWSLELLGSAVSRIDTTAPNPFPGMLVFADAEVLYTPGHTLSKDGCYNGDARALRAMVDAVGLRKQDNSLFSRAVAAANQHQASSTRAVGGGAPMWLEHAQKAVGRKLKEYVTVDGHWDVYIVSKVMQGYFREAFAPKLGHQNTSGHSIPLHELESRNCTVLGTLLQTLERRTRRAHTVNEPTTTEAEVLDSLRCMAEVLEQFQGPAAAAGMQQLLEEAHALVKVCRSNSGIAPTPTKPFAVATEHAQRLLAHTLSTSLSASCSWPWAPSNTRMGLRLAATGQVCRHDRPVQRAP
jgi:hypothetical protein